jgi:dihydroorotase-like cyclic amidohydrolase
VVIKVESANPVSPSVVDAPGHGDGPKDEEYERIATENQARADAGEELYRD